MDAMKRSWLRPVLAVALIAAGIVAARALGLGEAIKLENLGRLKQWIESYGGLAPAIFIAGYVLAAVLFVPGLPMTVLGGVVFGPIWGTVYVWVAATVGAGLAFLIARYAVRSTVERWVRASPRIAKVDGQVAEHGWRIVMLTRLVPVFPFNLQNYAYGITRIGFWPYVITSAICMLPGTAAFTFAGGALSDGRGNVRRTLAYLAVAGVLLVLVSLIPRWLARRSRLAGELLKSGLIIALLAGALPAAAADDAYTRLLKAHVRPGVSGGIRLNLVDYRAVKADPAYAEALCTPYSLDAIEHGILRKSFQEPRVHFAIVCASRSCPDLRPEPFEAAASDVAIRIRALTDAGLSYLDYDWSLNDTARVSS